MTDAPTITFSPEGLQAEISLWLRMKQMGNMLPKDGVCVEEFVLKHGRSWTAAQRPKGWRRKEMKQCFANSQRTLIERWWAGDESLTYVEGFAYHGKLGTTFKVHHGWLVDEEGRVIDLTWECPESSIYFGVPFQTEYVKQQASTSGMWATLLYHEWTDFELLRGITPIAEALKPWPSS